MTHVKIRKNSEAKRAYRKEGSKSRSRRRRRRRRKRRAENKKKVTTGVNLRSRFALNFDFTIVVLAISPLAKSSLKGFRSFFYFFSLFFSLYNPHCHDFTSPMSLVVSSPSYTLSPFRYAHKPIPSYADSFSLAHFFFPLLLAFSSFSACQSFVPCLSSLIQPAPERIFHLRLDSCSSAFFLLLFANTIYHRVFLFIGTIYFYLQPDKKIFRKKISLDIIYR